VWVVCLAGLQLWGRSNLCVPSVPALFTHLSRAASQPEIFAPEKKDSPGEEEPIIWAVRYLSWILLLLGRTLIAGVSPPISQCAIAEEEVIFSPFYKGSRLYGKQHWNYDDSVTRGNIHQLYK
jgi:hypothetical protein